MHWRKILVSMLLCSSSSAWGEGTFIRGSYEHSRVEPALQWVKQNPERHVLVYLGAFGCGPCQFTAHQLNIPEVASKLSPHLLVVEAFAWYPQNEEDWRVIGLYGKKGWRMPSVAPILAVVNSEGQEVVRLVGGLGSTREALLLGDFIAGRHYRRTNFHTFVAEHSR